MNSADVFKVVHTNQLGQRVFTLLEVDGNLLVNMDVICDRRYHILGVDELMYEIGRRGRDKTLIFLFQDGANIEYSGAYDIVQQSIRQLELTPDRCVVFYPGEIAVPGATVVDNQSYQSWELHSRQLLLHVPLAQPVFNKHFCALYARFNLYRLKLARHLRTQHADKSIVAFNNTRVNYGVRFLDEFNDDYSWAKENLPIRLDGNDDTINQADGFIGYQSALSNIENLYQQYFIEIVSETDPHSNVFFTEKTTKNFWLGKPFLLYSGAGSLATLRKKGYATFGPYIDESYDAMENDFDRLTAIKFEIDRLAAMSIDELRDIHVKLGDVFEYNRSLVKLNTRDWAHDTSGQNNQNNI